MNLQDVKIIIISFYFRFYDISSPDKLILRFPLFGVLHHNVGTVTSNISSALGDDAVDFDVGESVCDKRGVVTNSIFVLQETGDVWTVYGKFTHNRYVLNVMLGNSLNLRKTCFYDLYVCAE